MHIRVAVPLFVMRYLTRRHFGENRFSKVELELELSEKVFFSVYFKTANFFLANVLCGIACPTYQRNALQMAPNWFTQLADNEIYAEIKKKATTTVNSFLAQLDEKTFCVDYRAEMSTRGWMTRELNKDVDHEKENTYWHSFMISS